MTATPLYPMIHLKGDDIEVVITHNDQYGEEFYSFVNGQHTILGGHPPVGLQGGRVAHHQGVLLQKL